MTNKQREENKRKVNKLRGPLMQCGLNADDMDTKTLNNAEKIFDAIISMKKACENAELVLSTTNINYHTLEKATGIDHHTISNNKTYKLIVDTLSIPKRKAEENQDLKKLKIKIQQMQKELDEYHRREQENYSYEIKIAHQAIEIDNLRKNLEAMTETKKQATDRIEELSRLLNLQSETSPIASINEIGS